MSTGRDHDETLEEERGVNEAFKRAAHETAHDLDSALGTANYEAGVLWIGTVRQRRSSADPVLIGRVAIDRDVDPIVDGELYVSDFELLVEFSGVSVVSWASRVGNLLNVEPRKFDERGILATRRFSSRGQDLINFSDDFAPGATVDVFPPALGGELQVPQPSKRRRPVQRPEIVGGDDKESIDPPADEDDGRREKIGLVAENLVLEAVNRPRSGRLNSLLATLQPEQNLLVRWPDDQPLIVSGQPGTGKTVVALHRAAYLTHPEREGGPLARVAVVGPTDGYREHVQDLSPSIGGGVVPVVGLPELMARLAGVDIRKVRRGPLEYAGVLWSLHRSVRRARQLVVSDSLSGRELRERVLNALIADSEIHQEVVSDSDASAWLLEIPDFATAQREERFLPLLATIGLVVDGPGDNRRDHLIIDEAQDVPWLVWPLLSSLLDNPRSMSIFGDMNQRRSDYSYDSWLDLAVNLELTDDEGEVTVHELKTGYRSTRAILDFANQLLPRGDRVNHAIREGTPPQVIKVGRDELISEVVRSAESLANLYPSGLTAVITMFPSDVSDRLRKLKWKRSNPANLIDGWTNGAGMVLVMHPDRARGLEFDGVVVVEPDRFPLNLGREGVLYTSLTRATQTLHVVYSGSLPKRLR